MQQRRQNSQAFDPLNGADETAQPTENGLAIAVGVAMCVAALYLARDVLVPLSLAALLSFGLTPPMMWLRRHMVPRSLSVVIVVTFAFVAIFAMGRLIVGQVSSLTDNLPQYQQNLEQKVSSLQGATAGGGLLGRFSDLFNRLGQGLDGGVDSASAHAPQARNGVNTDARRPVPVEIQSTSPAALRMVQSILGPLLGPLADTGLIILFVISFLFQRESLRDRFIRLVGSRDLHRTTEALNEAGHRVSRYLLMQLLVNATYSVPIFLGLSLIGVPNPLLWALLVVMLRVVPYVGIVIAALFPLALATAVDPGWDKLIYTAALFVSMELVFGNVIEPWLYGMNTGLSPVAIIVAATFWTWLWGPIGLLLSTPLTVCLVVLGRHAPPLRFLHVLLGNDAPLAPAEAFYQRLLADDPVEAAEHCEAFLKDHSLTQIYDEVIVPALALAHDDAARGVLNRRMRIGIRQGIAEVIETFSTLDTADAAHPGHAGEPGIPDGSIAALCIVGRNDLDEAAAGLLVQLLHKRGIAARLVLADAITPGGEEEELMDVRGTANTRVICLSYMGGSPLKARLLIRKLRRLHLSDTRIIAGFWSDSKLNDTARDERKAATGADMIVTTLHEAVEQIQKAAPVENSSLSALVQAAASAVQNRG